MEDGNGPVTNQSQPSDPFTVPKKRKRPPLSPEAIQKMRDRRRNRIANGTCSRCDQPPVPGQKQCERHAEMGRNACRHRRAGPLKNEIRERQTEMNKLRVARRKEQGVCLNCPATAVAGQCFCEACRDRMHLQGARRRRKNRADGRCRCGNPSGDKLRCAGCREERRDRTRCRTAALKSAGLCAACGKRPAADGKTRCRPCRDKFNDMSLRRRRDRMADGLCTICGRVPHTANSSVCEGCYFKQVSMWRVKSQRIAGDIKAIWERQGGRCAYTGRKLTLGVDAELDHIVPESAGGSNEADNAQWTHMLANSMKFSQSEEAFLAMVSEIYHHRCAPRDG